MDPRLILSQKDARPMYLQIMSQIKQRIAQGDWPQGAKAPSIRELAVASRISVITVKRAYQELEREGVFVTRPGVGSFVAEQDNLGDRIMYDEIDAPLKQALKLAQRYGLSAEELAERLKLLSQDGGEENHE